MARTRIKICGVRDLETALAAAAAGADAVGLVFVERSPRCVDVKQAKNIIANLPAFVEPVGLFVDEPVEAVRDVTREVGLRTIQLHGHEGPGYIQRLAEFRIIKSMGFEPGHVREMLTPWRQCGSNLAALLWDTPQTSDAPLTGGSGRSFDWDDLSRMIDEGLMEDMPPLILAGGLNADNVAQAVRTIKPYAVDVSSGVESQRGVKDIAKITRFVQAVRKASSV